MADFAVDVTGGKVVIRCQVGDCEWSATPAEADAAGLWDSVPLLRLWADHLREDHAEHYLA